MIEMTRKMASWRCSALRVPNQVSMSHYRLNMMIRGPSGCMLGRLLWTAISRPSICTRRIQKMKYGLPTVNASWLEEPDIKLI
jgi:hypothetical protein